MYDELLSINFGTNCSGDSSASLVGFTDDIEVVITGQNMRLLEETTNRVLEAVVDWLEENDLKLSINKTEAMLLP